jgi:hypothetical protein
MSEDQRKKLEILLDYWVKHNRRHGEEFKEWAEKAKKWGDVMVHGNMLEAVQRMDEANEFLLRALEGLQGGSSG